MSDQGKRYKFFVSHVAREGGPELTRFYEDLRREVDVLDNRTTLDIGFLEVAEVNTGDDWAAKIATAINNSEVLVLMVSPNCFKSHWCGKELGVFIKRLEEFRYTGGGDKIRGGWRPIIPVIWVPWIKGQEPPVLKSFQWTDRRLPDEYRREGLLHLLRCGDRFQSEYRVVVRQIARRITDISSECVLPSLDRDLEWDTLKNAFEINSEPLLQTHPAPPAPLISPGATHAGTQTSRSNSRNWQLLAGVGLAGLLGFSGMVGGVYYLWDVSDSRPDTSNYPSSTTTHYQEPVAPPQQFVTTMQPITPPVGGMVPIPSPDNTPVLNQVPRHLWGRSVYAEQLLDINGRANFGNDLVRSGFAPDPWTHALTAGGGTDPINVRRLVVVDAEIGQFCGESFVTRRPDFHFTFQAGTMSLLRFYVITESGADATLLVNQQDGRWRCNDDHGRAGWGHPQMPVIDFLRPQSGRYDIWVGTYGQSAGNPATLYVTELSSQHP